MNPTIEAARKQLATKVFDQGVHWRILFIGRSVNGTTDIVSSLSRSLRNLGHHVLDIDLKKHRNLSENPNKVTGGHGPIFVKTAPLEPLLNRFKPQMIVCCAGGLTFHPAEAEALKQRGIVLVGLTLSDPDVFPSVHGHAHVFDFHTTNAHIALAMYRDQGVHNTVYFPFGIDRGFVTQTVAEAPDLAADVICIGHATARPERNSLMTQLATEFDVKTYGRGWDIPGSEVVAGERMIQATRMGKIHINFPLTRAGYINIKCGVFESVAAGALICTGRFSEMETFFSYENEIIGYDEAGDLSVQLKDVLARPERYREITENAFQRLINEHLYEHRWMSLFETIFNVSAGSAPWLSPERIAAIRKTLSASLPRAKKVILSGFYGASNLGDELILTSIRQALEKADPGIQVCVGGENAQSIERDHGLQAFVRRNHYEALQAVRTASAVVLGGGGLWHDYTFARSGGLMGLFSGAQISIAGFGTLPLLGRMFDLPFHVVGMGVGPLEHADAMRMVKFVASNAETIYIRDDESDQLLKNSGISGDHVKVAPDVVYALQLPQPSIPAEVSRLKEEGCSLIGLNLRPWARMDEDRVVAAVADAIKAVGATRRVAVVGIPMQAGDKVDVAILKRVAKALGARVEMVVLPAPLNIETLCGVVSQLDALLSMRLHACLVAHRMRKPVVGIAYDPKVSSHFAELGRSHLCLPIALDASVYRDALLAALDEKGALPESVCATLSLYEQQASAALAMSVERIARLPSPQVVYEVPGALDVAPVVAAPAAPAAVVKPASAAAAAVAVAGARARFGAAKVNTSIAAAQRVGEKFGNGADTLEINLPVELPLTGQTVTIESVIDLPSSEAVELAMVLESKYENKKTLGRIAYSISIEDLVYVEDLAQTREALQVRVLAAGRQQIKVALTLSVARDSSGPSAAWPSASKIKLRLLAATPTQHDHSLLAFSNRGALVPAKARESKVAA